MSLQTDQTPPTLCSHPCSSGCWASCSASLAAAFQSAELIRLADSGTGAVHRLLTRLTATGLVTATRNGNRKLYQANAECPVFHELCAVAGKLMVDRSLPALVSDNAPDGAGTRKAAQGVNL